MAYPGSLDSFTANTDDVDDVLAADVNELQTAIVAIETELGTDPAGTAATLKARLAHSINDAGMLEFDDCTELTLSGGAVTVTQNYHKLDTEADAASDDLDTINGNTAGLFIILRTVSDDRDVVIKHDTGNIYCADGVDITLGTTYQFAFGIYDDSQSRWLIASKLSSTVSTATGADNRIAIYTAANAIQGDANLTWTGTELSVDGSAVINDSGADRDVRIEGDTATNLFLSNAGSDAIQIGTTTAGAIADFRAANIVLNEVGADNDIRMEGDTATSLLKLDAGLDAVQIGTTTAGVIADFRTAAIVFNEDGTADRDFRMEGDTDTDLLHVDTSTDRIGVGIAAPLAKEHVKQTSLTGAVPVQTLEQIDQDFAFTDYVGTSAADQTKSISTVNGDGTVEGPKNFSASAGWAFAGMIRQKVNGTDVWIPYYTADTS